jgi:hypothetical protein
MSADLDARVRRANLITRNHQLERLYGDDLSPRLLRDVYSKKEGRMSEITDRPEQSAIKDVPADEKTFRPTRPSKKRSPAFVPAILTAVIAIGVIVALVARQPAPVVAQTPVEIAEAFMNALNEHDADAVFALMAEGAVVPEGDSEFDMRGEIRMEELQGWTYEVENCAERPGSPDNQTRVFCAYSFTNVVAEALGTGPYTGNGYDFVIENGEVTRARQAEPDGLQSVGVFLEWVDETHPEAGEMYYHYIDDENLAKWDLYLPDWLASLEGAG